ncbi:MAG TPA: hypothetical protein PLX95_03870 [bacterium]|nr:hypothetical protein [bacterium]
MRSSQSSNNFNKYINIFFDKDIFKFITSKDKAYKSINKRDKKEVGAFKDKARQDLNTLLKKKGIPLSWQEPICSTIWNPACIVPIYDGIHIEVGDEVVTIEKNMGTDKKYLLKTEKKNSEKKYNIVVSRNVTKKDFIDFINTHWEFLSGLQKTLNLPKDPPIRTSKTLHAIDVIGMRDFKRKSFEEIATEMFDYVSNTENINPTEKKRLLKTFSSGDNVRKNVYERFKTGFLNDSIFVPKNNLKKK